MKVVIVAKTRRGAGACIGGITLDGRSVRLIADDAATNARAGLEYQFGEVWETAAESAPDVVPPHVENVIVKSARRLGLLDDMDAFIRKHMPPVIGGVDVLFEGLLQPSSVGALFIAERTGLPSHSTLFWIPDQPLRMNCEGKRIRYRYPTADGGRTLTFVGFQEPVELLPAGTLLRVSLAHWWRPNDGQDEELRCYAQLSGWLPASRHSGSETALGVPIAETTASDSPTTVAGQNDDISAEANEPQPGASDVETGVGAESLLWQARQLLKQRFGFAEFLPTQEPVISRVLARRDTLAVMPTGGGKSICYQLPALLFDGLTLVVSPLIALMQDQVNQLRELDIPAGFLNSTLAYREYLEAANSVRLGKLRILYAAPETLLRPETLLLLEQSRLTCLAVDEAHCISEWGHDFRPEYRQLHEVRRRFPDAVCIALTATATGRVRDDIRRLLNIEPAGEFVASFNRPNLFLDVAPRRDGLGQTLAFLDRWRDQAGIIYCTTRKQVDQLAAELQARGRPALPYHAGLDDDVRRRNQDEFIREDAVTMVATVAFGMGINKSNVRFVLHYNLPKDLESYYQEIGRAGRDSLPAECLLLHSRADSLTTRRFIQAGAESERAGRQARLDAMVRYAEARSCRREALLGYFGEALKKPCGHCDRCLAPEAAAPGIDVTEAAQKFLSCVKRTGELFGASYIVDVLRGSRSERVLARQHDQLSTYGIGRELTVDVWRDRAQQFIEQGLLDQDHQFGSLRVTPKGWRVMKGEKVFAALVPGNETTSVLKSAPGGHDHALFERLRALRRQLASEANVPPYVIFSDRALVEMATFYPLTERQFMAINGVGEAKLARYGSAFLELIRAHCHENGLESRRPDDAVASESVQWMTGSRRYEQVGREFAAGQTLEQLAGRYKAKKSTLVAHLLRFAQGGGVLDPAKVLVNSSLSPADQARVVSEFERLGLERLRPVHEALHGAIGYDELNLVRLYMQCRGGGGASLHAVGFEADEDSVRPGNP